MADIKISFIIPVYNPSEKDGYFLKCIESVNKIRHASDEVLVVDDGSENDGYIKRVCNSCDGISIIRIDKNSGISHARNVGIKSAHNEFVVIADSDDYFNAKAFERARKQVINNCGYDLYIFGTIGKVNGRKAQSLCSSKQVDIADLRVQAIHRRSANYQPKLHSIGSTWGKIIRKEFIADNKLEFCHLPNRAEDEVFFLDFLAEKPRIKVIEEYAYFYRTNPTSISNAYRKDEYELYRNTIIEMAERIDTSNRKEYEAFLRRKSFYTISPIHQVFRAESKKSFPHRVQTVKTILYDNNNLETIRTVKPEEYCSGWDKALVGLLKHRMVLIVSIVLEARRQQTILRNHIKKLRRIINTKVRSTFSSKTTKAKLHPSPRPISAFRSLL